MVRYTLFIIMFVFANLLRYHCYTYIYFSFISLKSLMFMCLIVQCPFCVGIYLMLYMCQYFQKLKKYPLSRSAHWNAHWNSRMVRSKIKKQGGAKIRKLLFSAHWSENFEKVEEQNLKFYLSSVVTLYYLQLQRYKVQILYFKNTECF